MQFTICRILHQTKWNVTWNNIVWHWWLMAICKNDSFRSVGFWDSITRTHICWPKIRMGRVVFFPISFRPFTHLINIENVLYKKMSCFFLFIEHNYCSAIKDEREREQKAINPVICWHVEKLRNGRRCNYYVQSIIH